MAPPKREQGPNMKIVLRELKKRDLSVHDVEALLRVKRSAARSYLAHIHAEKKSFVSGWKVPKSGPATAIYRFGIGVDVPRPVARPAIDRKRDIRKKRRAIRALVRSDPLLAAFFKKPRRRVRRAAPAAAAPA